jgi:hypothetical protein
MWERRHSADLEALARLGPKEAADEALVEGRLFRLGLGLDEAFEGRARDEPGRARVSRSRRRRSSRGEVDRG